MKQDNLFRNMNRAFLGMSLALCSMSATAANPEITDKVWRMSASVLSVGRPVDLINDGNANVNAPYWSSQHGSAFYGQYEYVELQWEFKAKVSSIQVFWATASGDIALPTDAYVAYWDGNEWVKSTPIDNISKRGLSNTATDVSSDRIRIYMKSDKACGIREVNVYGEIVYDPSVAYKWPSYSPTLDYDSYHSKTVTDQTFQQNACVHEGIHAIFADLEGCKQSAWYQEAGNTWLQAEAEVKKSGKTPESMGYLSAGNMIAPFMPIECYSGWLLDDSFGGPSAEGVNMYGDNGQICTWRNLLGGVQYGELFPHFVSEILGKGSIPWIWRNCKTRVLEGMAGTLGDRQMRHLITEYRARQAMIDVGVWSTACRKLLNDNWLVDIKQEWSPYSQSVKTWQATPYANMYKCNETDSAGWYYPEYRTTPGWSGANQVPLHVDGTKGNTVSIHFKPLGSNMVCQLCYRTKRGKIYYSQPVEGEGDVAMTLHEEPANGVVIAVISNTDYIYENDETRKRHFDYRLKMGEHVYQPAKAQMKWYMYTLRLSDPTFKKPTTGIENLQNDEAAKFALVVNKTIVRAGESLPISVKAAGRYQIPVVMYSANGAAVYSQSFMRDGDYHIPGNLSAGLYFLKAYNGRESSAVKIIVK